MNLEYEKKMGSVFVRNLISANSAPKPAFPAGLISSELGPSIF